MGGVDAFEALLVYTSYYSIKYSSKQKNVW